MYLGKNAQELPRGGSRLNSQGAGDGLSDSPALLLAGQFCLLGGVEFFV